MPLPIAPGVPAMDSTGAGYIPQIYSLQMQIVFYAMTVLSAISNTNHKNEIMKFGDEVIIPTMPVIQMFDGTVGEKEETQEPAPPDPVLLKIDKYLYWKFPVRDIHKAQSHLPYDEAWRKDGAQRLKIEVERRIFADIFTAGAAANMGSAAGAISGNIALGVSGTPLTLTADTILGKITDAAAVLDEQNVPDDGRWIVFPARFIALLKNSPLKNANEMGDARSVLRNGKVGDIDRFSVYWSNLVDYVSGTGGFNILFGHKSALTFAGQIDRQEKLRSLDEPADIYRGYFVYGYKVEKPEALGVLYAKV